jgi:hypothetical protein
LPVSILKFFKEKGKTEKMRKILFEKQFDEEECCSVVFAGPSDKDGSYALITDCNECSNEIQVVLSEEEIIELYNVLHKVKISIER